MHKKIICLAVLALVCFSPSGQAKGHATENETPIVFICHKGLNYTQQEVEFSYKAYLDESRPVDNRELFQSMLEVINYSPERYKKMWTKMAFRRAIFIPKMFDNDEEVIMWVASSHEGIGYVRAVPRNNPNIEICGSNTAKAHASNQ